MCVVRIRQPPMKFLALMLVMFLHLPRRTMKKEDMKNLVNFWNNFDKFINNPQFRVFANAA